MNTIASSLLVLTAALLAGCVAFAPAPGYYGEPYHYYASEPVFYFRQPVYVPGPVHRPYPGGSGGVRPGRQIRDHDHDRGRVHDRDRDRSRDRDRVHVRDHP